MKAHALPNGKVALRYGPQVNQWRHHVQYEAAEVANLSGMDFPILGPVKLELGFDLPRPQAHYGTGRNSHTLKASSPTWPTVMPDLDKLVRAICDSLTDAGLWKDDSHVVYLIAAKRYADGPPGVLIQVEAL